MILLGVAVAGLFEVESSVQVYGNSLMMVLVAFGVGMIVHWGMLWGARTCGLQQGVARDRRAER